MRCVLERWSGGLTRNPSGVVCVRSAGISPSRISLSLNLKRTHSPSERGRLVNVLRVSDSESPNSRTKYTPLISRRSIEITVPEVFKSSSLPSCTNCSGDTYPETVSRSILRTITFLCVEGILLSCHPQAGRIGIQIADLRFQNVDRFDRLGPQSAIFNLKSEI